MTAKKESDEEVKIVIRNRRAFHDYEITDRLEAGVVLVGTEVKSLRAGFANLDGAYAKIQDDELWLIGAEIPEYEMGNRLNHRPKRNRKLLVHRREIAKFAGKAQEQGYTLIPLQLHFRNGRAKVELGIARGKQVHDKRQAKKKAEAQREMRRFTAAKHRKRD